MAEIKTKQTKESVEDFVEKVADVKKREDSKTLLKIFAKATGRKPKMWGTSIIGYGVYHYKSERSKQEGDWPLTGFSPRKQNLTIYIMPGFDKYQEIIKKIGKSKTSVGCLYINKLDDIDLDLLEKLIKLSVIEMEKTHEVIE